MENIEDEIEYFGFLPITFTTDIQESLEETLADIMQRNGPVPGRIQTQIQDALKKNIFIFNNFVLRNILKFPQGFKLERKATDKFICEDVALLATAVHAAQQRVLLLKEQRRELLGQIGLQSDRINGYQALLRTKDKYADMIAGAREIRKFTRETNEIYESFRISGTRKESEFENLLEYKNIKNVYYKEERDRLLKIAGFDTLDYLAKKLIE